MKNLILVLAHQDDEFGIFNQILNFKFKNNIYVFYMTSGYSVDVSSKKTNRRDRESIKSLTKLKVKRKNINFIGKKLNIKVNNLYKNLDKTFQTLRNEINKIKGPKLYFTHSLEGGHEDHDACYYITKKLLHKKKHDTGFQFPLYHGNNMPWIFFKVFALIKENGVGYKKKISIANKLKFVSLLFNYKSQPRVWFFLYPFIIINYLFNSGNFIQKLEKNLKIRKPHDGKLFYERRNSCSYDKFHVKIKTFFSK